MIIVEKDAFKSIVLEKGVRVNEDDTIQFIVESTGEAKEGVVLKIQGSKKERKLLIKTIDSECEELWSLFSIQEDSLKVLK